MNRVTPFTTSLVALVLVASSAPGLVYESERELVANGDFDGDGRDDIVIVDKASGILRLSYQRQKGAFTWVDCRPTNAKDVAGLTVGRLLDPKRDALVLASAEGNFLAVVDVSKLEEAVAPVPIPFTAMGPSAVVAVDVGGTDNTPLHDLLVCSIYNDPPNRGTLFRNDGGKFQVLGEAELPAQAVRGNRVALKAGGTEFAAGILTGDKEDTFRVEDFSSGEPRTVIEVAGLPKGSDYAIGSFRGQPLRDVIFYQRGGKEMTARAVVESTPGAFRLDDARSFSVREAIGQAFVLAQPGNRAQLLMILGKGESAQVFRFDGATAPSPTQTIAAGEGEAFFSAVVCDSGFVLFSAPSFEKASVNYHCYQPAAETWAAGPAGKLPSLSEKDAYTVPELYRRIVETLNAEKIAAEADMKPYTNTIPGTQVTYSMVPIRGGDFVMGSPDGEAGRQPDEGPQHRVKISPFWIGTCEVTWNEYEVFMYPDDEIRLREGTPTPEYVNQLSDAVSRPSKPYVEMSFGMGKNGFPAISMTQHAANKYCQWLTAKTGHFYRLPTEAEWEYACRAGTSTAYFFGDDPKKLEEYAWFEQNSDFKYGKVGKKKANPWGLYDMHGNVWEWCLDQYETNYARFVEQLTQDPWVVATQPYPHTVRGGSFDDPADKLRSASRRGSSRDWKMRDPQLPKSIWWLTDAQTVGFRLVRPLKVPPPKELRKCWISGVEKD
jgi:formylglycine-generating enzyme required for sulfatase activity